MSHKYKTIAYLREQIIKNEEAILLEIRISFGKFNTDEEAVDVASKTGSVVLNTKPLSLFVMPFDPSDDKNVFCITDENIQYKKITNQEPYAEKIDFSLEQLKEHFGYGYEFKSVAYSVEKIMEED